MNCGSVSVVKWDAKIWYQVSWKGSNLQRFVGVFPQILLLQVYSFFISTKLIMTYAFLFEEGDLTRDC